MSSVRVIVTLDLDDSDGMRPEYFEEHITDEDAIREYVEKDLANAGLTHFINDIEVGEIERD